MKYVQLIRPKQWIKNGFVFAPLLFSMKFLDPASCVDAFKAFVSFSLASSFIYILNDLQDAEEDRKHPVKSKRPIASGDVTKLSAISFAVIVLVLLATSLVLIPKTSCAIVIIYIIQNILYSRIFKHVAVIDVIIIALGFVLRVLMGAYAIDAPVSDWIIVATFLLSLFLGFSKRRHEIGIKEYNVVRDSLNGYSFELLDRLISISCGASLMSYALYSVEMGKNMIYTLPFVVFGLFRYLQLIYKFDKGGEPGDILTGDLPFLLNITLWLGAIILALLIN